MKIIDKVKKAIVKDSKELIVSTKCGCVNDCNKVLIIGQTKDKKVLEVTIDWMLSKDRPTEENRFASVVVDREYLMRSLIASGPPLSNLEKFLFALDYYASESIKVKKNHVMSDLDISELKLWVNEQIKKKYKK